MYQLLSSRLFATLLLMPKPTGDKRTRDFLLRGLPKEVADKLKVAASLHRQPMKDYIRGVLEAHLAELEKKGVTLSLSRRRAEK